MKDPAMIEQASITTAADGSVLITVEKTGMSLTAEAEVSVSGRVLTIAQGGRAFVSVEVDDEEALESLAKTTDLTVVEVDENGFDFHEAARMKRRR
jgi:hypothetical protein